MLVYAQKPPDMPVSKVADYARRAEALGYDGMTVSEGAHDGVLSALAALANTSRIKVATSILVAFPRSPMILATAAWDLQEVSGGRLQLGLGTQVRGNIERRFSTQWTKPVPRMRDYIAALRTIWRCWQDHTPLQFESEHYRFSLMQDHFNPGPIPHPDIPIFLGAVGPAMTRLVGEVADGMLTHPTNSDARYLRDVTIPSIQEGAKRAGRPASDVAHIASPPIIAANSAAELQRLRDEQRKRLSFVYSTPNYWGTLNLHGLQDVGQQLFALSKEKRWDDMGAVLADDILDRLVPTGTYGDIASILKQRYDGLVTGLRFPLPDDPARDPDVAKVVAALKG